MKQLSASKQTLGMIAVILMWCIALVTVRLFIAEDGVAFGLYWNLFLATLPLIWGAAFEKALEAKHHVPAAVFFVLWILFLPNAPYISTDLIHLGPRPHVPLWYLLAMLMSCAGAGAMLGYLSLITVHRAVQRAYSKTMGWSVATASLMLCGFGIYLGRFLRWNSWNAITDPLLLLKTVVCQFIDPGPYPHPLSVTLVYGFGLIIGYLFLRVTALSIRPE